MANKVASVVDQFMLVTVAVAAGREDAYRHWHDAHIAEIVTHVDGVLAARRYELATPELPPRAHGTARFAALYELSTAPDAVRASLAAARGAGLVSSPPPGVVTDGLTLFYRAAGECSLT